MSHTELNTQPTSTEERTGVQQPAPENGSTQPEQEKRFTQSDVDRIVKERLKRAERTADSTQSADLEARNTEIGAEMRARGVVAMLDGAAVVKVPAVRLPEKFGFMLAHPSATVAPVKLEDFGIHNDTPLSSGTIVTGRVCYDAFVLDNKKSGIYYQSTT